MVRTDQPLVERMALVFHDWFATSQAERLQAAADDRPVEPLPRRLLRLLPRPLQGGDRRPGDAAVAERRRKHASAAPNENYAREMMELFSLGADRGAYTEDDIREQARALTGWRNDWSEDAGRPQLPLRPQTPRRQHQDDLRPDRATGTGKTPAGSASRTRSTPPSSSTSCGATSSPSRRRRSDPRRR